VQLLERLAQKAMELGELESRIHPTQLAFELDAILVSASTTFILQRDASVIDRARAAVRRLLPG
jgi:hypothetical protein